MLLSDWVVTAHTYTVQYSSGLSFHSESTENTFLGDMLLKSVLLKRDDTITKLSLRPYYDFLLFLF